jgi:hypothetical protein
MEDLANLLTTHIRLDCRRPVRKLETGTKRASQVILPKQYSHDLGVIVSRLLEENVSRCVLHLSVDANTTSSDTSSNTLSVCSQLNDRLQPVFLLTLP